MAITISRLILLPFIAYFLATTDANTPAWPALFLYLVAVASDWLDGVLARHWQVTTSFGGMLDETADKIFTTLILLIYADQNRLGTLGIIAAALLIGRDLLMGGLRYHWAQTPTAPIKVGYLGKVKTFCLMLVLGAYLMNWPSFYLDLGLCITALLSLYSMQSYTRAATIAISATKI